MIINERDSRAERVIAVGRQMLTAARTAPKAKGLDLLECCLLTGDDIVRLSEEMARLYDETGRPVFKRDGVNILKADCVVIIATHIRPMGLNCGHCGFPTCGDKPAQIPCAFNPTDIGIALGSAVATAADLRVDTRVMYSAGIAAQRLNLLDGCALYFAIPVSASSKSPFFDRQP
ncbi:MAG: ferredoxin [Muribaculaceae bacterium]|nr:ferredoxin [Muribaculaceae bacterium]